MSHAERPVVVAVAAAEVLPLRQLVLRPHQELSACAFNGDQAPDTLHAGVSLDGELVGVATVMREPPPGASIGPAWRIRGMATLPAFRGRGIGGALLERCVAHAAEHGATLLWCNARVAAAGLYLRAGFRRAGEPFELPGIGLHHRMWLEGLPGRPPVTRPKPPGPRVGS